MIRGMSTWLRPWRSALGTDLPALFSDEKVLDAPALNLVGAQVFRTVAAHCIHRVRRPPTESPDLDERIRTLEHDGVLVWKDFLPSDDFDRLSGEFASLLERQKQAFHRSARSSGAWSVNVERLGPRLVPETLRLLRNRTLRSLIERAEKRPWSTAVKRCNLQAVVQPEDPTLDDQTELHVDTFFPTHKIWLYVTDVGPLDGCLSVVKGSQKLTCRSLWATYRHSLRRDVDPSRRVNPEEIEASSLTETPIICPKNTLVIANVHAMHRRLPGAPGRVRLAVHLSARSNPFRLRALGDPCAEV